MLMNLPLLSNLVASLWEMRCGAYFPILPSHSVVDIIRLAKVYLIIRAWKNIFFQMPQTLTAGYKPKFIKTPNQKVKIKL